MLCVGGREMCAKKEDVAANFANLVTLTFQRDISRVGGLVKHVGGAEREGMSGRSTHGRG